MFASRVTVFLVAAFALSAQGLVNRRAPSFSLPDSALKQHDILDYRGSWLLLDFMETNCPSCKELSKKLEPVKAKYGSKVGILSIVIPPPETQATVAKYIAETYFDDPVQLLQRGDALEAFDRDEVERLSDGHV